MTARWLRSFLKVLGISQASPKGSDAAGDSGSKEVESEVTMDLSTPAEIEFPKLDVDISSSIGSYPGRQKSQCSAPDPPYNLISNCATVASSIAQRRLSVSSSSRASASGHPGRDDTEMTFADASWLPSGGTFMHPDSREAYDKQMPLPTSHLHTTASAHSRIPASVARRSSLPEASTVVLQIRSSASSLLGSIGAYAVSSSDQEHSVLALGLAAAKVELEAVDSGVGSRRRPRKLFDQKFAGKVLKIFEGRKDSDCRLQELAASVKCNARRLLEVHCELKSSCLIRFFFVVSIFYCMIVRQDLSPRSPSYYVSELPYILESLNFQAQSDFSCLADVLLLGRSNLPEAARSFFLEGFTDRSFDELKESARVLRRVSKQYDGYLPALVEESQAMARRAIGAMTDLARNFSSLPSRRFFSVVIRLAVASLEKTSLQEQFKGRQRALFEAKAFLQRVISVVPSSPPSVGVFELLLHASAESLLSQETLNTPSSPRCTKSGNRWDSFSTLRLPSLDPEVLPMEQSSVAIQAKTEHPCSLKRFLSSSKGVVDETD